MDAGEMGDAPAGTPGLAATMIDGVRQWAEGRDDIRAVVLVGSHARGDAKAGSDIDLVLVCSNPAAYVRRTGWVSCLAEVAHASKEEWGNLRSLRVHYRNGAEVEFGITGLDWATVPPDPGTAAVLKNGSLVLLDRDLLLHRVMEALGPPA